VLSITTCLCLHLAEDSHVRFRNFMCNSMRNVCITIRNSDHLANQTTRIGYSVIPTLLILNFQHNGMYNITVTGSSVPVVLRDACNMIQTAVLFLNLFLIICRKH
jgi:hypothetical protein